MDKNISLLTHAGYYDRLVEHWQETGDRRAAWQKVETELFEAFRLRRFCEYSNMVKVLRRKPRPTLAARICFVENSILEF